MSGTQPTLFLDRDGTINVDQVGGYVSRPELLELLPGAARSLERARDAGFKLAVITNQAGIGKGLYTIADLARIHEHLCKLLAHDLGAKNFSFDNIEFCPHRPDEHCNCRKPHVLMIERAAAKLSSDLSRSFYIGDKDADLLCAASAGVRSILVRTGYGRETEERIRHWDEGRPIAVTDTLAAAVEAAIAEL
ncbi:MAG: HAD family hydrolase [Deltaproteobacteria bacterium]|nr:HAD family hydrolase [Deltaproteobacteria bacterium]